MRRWLFAGVMLIASPGWAEWQFVGGTARADYYIEAASVRADGSRRQVLELLAIAREEEEPVLAERLVALEKCLEKLSDRDRKLIEARYVDRTPTDEIATSFCQSRRTMFRNLERVRRLLFDCIDRSVVLGGHA